MNRGVAAWVAIATTGVAGFGSALALVHSSVFRPELGELFDRGRLLALVDNCGIYQADLDRQLEESGYVAGIEEGKRTNAEREAALAQLVVTIAAQTRASRENVSSSELTNELNLLRFQFGDDKTWRAALRKSTLSPGSLSKISANNLKIRKWLGKQIASQLSVTETECREFYESHRAQFFVPERRNVSHLFLAAPPETPPDVVNAKQAAIETLSARLAVGEDFATLAAQNSEDEATKLRGGELGYFSAQRMPPDFVEAAVKMRPGEISKPVRTRLGLHILKLTDIQPPRQQTLEEVRGDISLALANEKRAAAIEKLTADLRWDVAYLSPF